MSQRILVTGANRGIGLAIATALLEGGHTVFAGTRQPSNSPELQSLARSSDQLTILALDITSDDSVAHASAGLESLDILVNNAGLFPEAGTEKLAAMSLDHFRAAFDTNVVGVARMIQAFAPILEKGHHPRIVNISSGAGRISDKNDFHYYAYATSKAALNMLTRAIAAEYAPSGITVVALDPGWVKTRMGGENAPLSTEDSGTAIGRTLLALTPAQSGTFIDRTGQPTRHGW